MLLVAALRSLPEPQRRALVLHCLLDLPIADAAAETGASVGTVKSWLSRGRARLGEFLGEPGSGDEAGRAGESGESEESGGAGRAVRSSRALLPGQADQIARLAAGGGSQQPEQSARHSDQNAAKCGAQTHYHGLALGLAHRVIPIPGATIDVLCGDVDAQ